MDEARYINIDEVADDTLESAEAEVLSIPLQEAIVIDVRHPSEEERKPLRLSQCEVIKIPFYELHSQFSALDQRRTYLLYCDKGVMSRLHASHLVAEGRQNVKVYRPG